MSWLSWAIRVFTGCKYNHAGILVQGLSGTFIVEALGRGVVRSEAAARLKDRIICVREPQFYFSHIDFINDSSKHIGKTAYDFYSLIVAQPVYQLTKERIWIGRKNDGYNRFYCSEFCAWVHRNHFPEWSKTSPMDLYEAENLKTVFEGRFSA